MSKKTRTKVAAKLPEWVADLLLQINAAMSTYLPDSELSRVNQTGAGVWVDLSPELAEVISSAERDLTV